jgi:3-deoxy-manno-octulosonate cytidylyltransferase (CMP-KDO synthetase)
MSFKIMIPAHFHSKRFPGKVLEKINGKTMIEHTYTQACKSRAADVFIVTPDENIAEVAKAFGAHVCMASSEHQSGTSRLTEAMVALSMDQDEEDQIIVNVQSDEPMIPPEAINQVAEDLAAHDSASISTLQEKIQTTDELFDANVVKVITNQRGFALYFSRAPIPWLKGGMNPKTLDLSTSPHTWMRHIGLYAYRPSFLNAFQTWTEPPMGSMEDLEQLKALYNGTRIHVATSKMAIPPSINTASDLKILEKWMS